MRFAERNSRRSRAVPSLLFATFLILGCGGDGRVPLFPADGKVLVDGKPAAGVVVRLVPADALGDHDALQPFATTGENGDFSLGTYDKGDGAPAGRYKVTLFQPDRPPGPAHPNDLLGGQYADPQLSKIEVVISEGPNTLKPFEVNRAAAAPQQSPVLHDADFPE
jgi:hypothetical protein